MSAQERAEAATAAADARAEALQVALREAGNAAATELAAVQQQHAAAMAALEQQLVAQQHQLAEASQSVLDLSAELAQLQAHNRVLKLQMEAGNSAAGQQGQQGADEGSVSLEAGMAPSQQQQLEVQEHVDVSPTSHMPAAAVSSSDDSSSKGGHCADPHHVELLSLLGERDAQLARLEASLAVTHAALEGQAELPGETGAAAQVGGLSSHRSPCGPLACCGVHVWLQLL
jgi:chromosome segregation ATPase